MRKKAALIFLEGGAEKDRRQRIRCQQAFHDLLDRMGFSGRKPTLVACGSRNNAYQKFVAEMSKPEPGADWFAMWIDSEDPIAEKEETWKHLKTRDEWDRPQGADDEQVLFMTTCMETWIVADHETLQKHYDGQELVKNRLPRSSNLENVPREKVYQGLKGATERTRNPFEKGKPAFELFGKLNPEALSILPSFTRAKRILKEKLSD